MVGLKMGGKMLHLKAFDFYGLGDIFGEVSTVAKKQRRGLGLETRDIDSAFEFRPDTRGLRYAVVEQRQVFDHVKIGIDIEKARGEVAPGAVFEAHGIDFAACERQMG